MNHRLFFVLLGTASLVSVASAQQAERPPIDLFQVIRDTPWTVNISLRQFSSNATTAFSGIGNMSTGLNSGPLTGGQVTRDYVDGTVGVDPTSNSGGLSRQWAHESIGQRVTIPGVGNGVAFNNYYTTAPTGYGVEADGDTSMGVDLAVTRRMLRLGRRWELGLTVGMGLTDVNMKQREASTIKLGRLQDIYSLRGLALPEGTGSYSAPDFAFVAVTNPDGTSSFVYQDNTIPLESAPYSRDDNPNFADATLNGFWQVKGAYYFLRVGPTLRARITERLQIAVSAGAAAGFLGTKFRYDELVETTAITQVLREQNEVSDDDFLPGYYGEAHVEYFLSQKTGFFVGASYEKLGDYEQVIGNRKATIELGKGVGLKLGIVTRF